jgi:hypothetical protein
MLTLTFNFFHKVSFLSRSIRTEAKNMRSFVELLIICYFGIFYIPLLIIVIMKSHITLNCLIVEQRSNIGNTFLH